MSGNRMSMRSRGTIAAALALSVLGHRNGDGRDRASWTAMDSAARPTAVNDTSVLAFPTIGAAVTAAAPGDTIKVCPGPMTSR